MRIKYLILSVLFAAFCLGAGALPSVADFFPSQNESFTERLFSGETVEAYTVRGGSTSEIAPYGTISWQLAKDTEGLDYAFSDALVSFVEYPQYMADMSENEKFVWLYNIAQSISTIRGITYPAYTTGKIEVLFSDTYMISGPDKKSSRIPDPVFTEVPVFNESYAYMKDSRFGGNRYRLGYYTYGREIFLEITNINTMKYMGFTAIKEGFLHMYVDAVMADEGVIVYGLAVIYNQRPQVNVLVTVVDLPTAFMKRINSLKNWFIEQVEEEN